MRFVFDEHAAFPGEARGGFLDVADGYFENGAERRAAFDEQVDVGATQGDHGRGGGDVEAELPNIKGGGFFGVFGLNQDVRAEAAWPED